MARPLDDKSSELQIELNRLAEKLDARPVSVGLRTNDGLNIFVSDDGSYHYSFYERGQINFDQVGDLDDVLYWYCKGVVRDRAASQVGNRAERFKYEYEVLSRFDQEWAKRRVRELANLFRDGQPQDLVLLPDIGEPL